MEDYQPVARQITDRCFCFFCFISTIRQCIGCCLTSAICIGGKCKDYFTDRIFHSIDYNGCFALVDDLNGRTFERGLTLCGRSVHFFVDLEEFHTAADDFILEYKVIVRSIYTDDLSVFTNLEGVLCSVSQTILSIRRNFFNGVCAVGKKIIGRCRISIRIGGQCIDNFTYRIFGSIYNDRIDGSIGDFKLDAGEISVTLGSLFIKFFIPFFDLYAASDRLIGKFSFFQIALFTDLDLLHFSVPKISVVVSVFG